MSLLTYGCKSEPKEVSSPTPTTAEVILRQDNLAIYQLYCPEFDALPERLQRYAYHLCRAAVAGRDIIFDQTIPKGLEIRQLLDSLILREDIEPALKDKIRRYTIKFWSANGNYDPETSRKFVPEFTFDEMMIALHGSRQENESQLMHQETFFKLYIFDPDFLPVLVNKNPSKGDAVTESAVNFYDRGITRTQVEAQKPRYPLNGRYALAGGQIVEEVYRAGAPDVAPGRMADRLENVVTELESALTYAPDASRPALEALIEYFRTGEPEAFDRHCRLWVQDNSSPVDYIIGFIEVYQDPLGMRGSFEGGVFITDSAETAMMKTLATNAAWFEERMPWEERFKKKDFTLPSAKAVKMLMGIGGEGPHSPSGINLPNDQRLRETVGTKNFMLTNVMGSGAKDRANQLFAEFIPTEMERQIALEGLDSRRSAMVALHEVVGHGSGKADASLAGDPLDQLKEFASTLEEARADLVAWWFVGDPRLVELGVHSTEVTKKSAYTAMLAYTLIDLRDVPEGDQYEEDHARAGHLINNFIIAKGGARIELIDGKHYCRLVDEELTHKAVGELLAEIQRIKATGDYPAAKKLVETYGIKFDPKLRDEVIARAKPLNVPDRIAFAMPEIELIKNKMGGIRGFEIKYNKDFAGQMIRFGR